MQKFCDYLEVEEIVSTWEPKQIAHYAKGVAARKAVETLFKQVKERLKDEDPKYDVKTDMPD